MFIGKSSEDVGEKLDPECKAADACQRSGLACDVGICIEFDPFIQITGDGAKTLKRCCIAVFR